MTKPSAVVLLSGGLDSAVTLALALRDCAHVAALSFDYGQRHRTELDAARAVAAAAGARDHTIARIDLRVFGGSALTADIAVPKDQPPPADAPTARVPITYVPARNTIFLSFALALAEVRAARAIYIGVNAVDFSGYPDCRPAFIAAFEHLANLGTRAGALGETFQVRAPLQALSKVQIIQLGVSLGVDLGLTRSCYDPDPAGRGCLRCESCLLRLQAFSQAGLTDPAPYVQGTP